MSKLIYTFEYGHVLTLAGSLNNYNSQHLMYLCDNSSIIRGKCYPGPTGQTAIINELKLQNQPNDQVIILHIIDLKTDDLDGPNIMVSIPFCCVLYSESFLESSRIDNTFSGCFG